MCWACDCQSTTNKDEKCGIIPSSTNNTINMWSHLRTRHSCTYIHFSAEALCPAIRDPNDIYLPFQTIYRRET
jgi:hypothetical protein